MKHEIYKAFTAGFWTATGLMSVGIGVWFHWEGDTFLFGAIFGIIAAISFSNFMSEQWPDDDKEESDVNP